MHDKFTNVRHRINKFIHIHSTAFNTFSANFNLQNSMQNQEMIAFEPLRHPTSPCNVTTCQ